MQNISPIEVAPVLPKRRGISLYNLFISMIVLVVCSVVALVEAYRVSLSPLARLTRQEAQVRQQQMALDLGYAQTAHHHLLRNLRTCQDHLLELFEHLRWLEPRLKPTLVNESGQKIALYPDLLRVARQVYGIEMAQIPTVREVNERLDDARRLEYDIRQSLGTAAVPSATYVALISDHVSWSEKHLRQASDVRKMVDLILRESYARTPEGLPTTPHPMLATVLELPSPLLDKTGRRLEAELLAKSQASKVPTNVDLKVFLPDWYWAKQAKRQ